MIQPDERRRLVKALAVGLGSLVPGSLAVAIMDCNSTFGAVHAIGVLIAVFGIVAASSVSGWHRPGRALVLVGFLCAAGGGAALLSFVVAFARCFTF